MATKILVRGPFAYDSDAVSQETGWFSDLPSLTVQDQTDEADINTIVKRFGLTGTLPQGVRVPTYGDFDGVVDYRDALEAIRAADESFMKMPAEVRAKFDNDAAAFVDFCSDPANVEQLRKWGLAVEKVNGKREDVDSPPGSQAGTPAAGGVRD